MYMYIVYDSLWNTLLNDSTRKEKFEGENE